MKLTVKSRQLVEREIELTESDINMVRKWAAYTFLNLIKSNNYKEMHTEVFDFFCLEFGIDPEIDADRIEFFEAVVNASL